MKPEDFILIGNVSDRPYNYARKKDFYAHKKDFSFSSSPDRASFESKTNKEDETQVWKLNNSY